MIWMRERPRPPALLPAGSLCTHGWHAGGIGRRPGPTSPTADHHPAPQPAHIRKSTQVQVATRIYSAVQTRWTHHSLSTALHFSRVWCDQLTVTVCLLPVLRRAAPAEAGQRRAEPEPHPRPHQILRHGLVPESNFASCQRHSMSSPRISPVGGPAPFFHHWPVLVTGMQRMRMDQREVLERCL